MRILILLLAATLAHGQMIINGNRIITGSLNTCTSAVGADAYACNLVGLGSYVTGACYTFIADVANTETATINFTALGAKTIKKLVGGLTNNLATDDIQAGRTVTICYDGTNMQIQSMGSNTGVRQFGADFNNPTVGMTGYLVLPFSCTIDVFDILTNAGTIGFRVWRIGSGTALPTVANTINSADLAISTGTSLHSSTLTAFTSTAMNKNDIIGINVTAVATSTWAKLSIRCQQ